MTRLEPYAYRRDAAVPAFDDAQPIIIFDGKCVLCSSFAAFVIKHDRRKRLRLLAAQTPLGEALYRHFDLRYDDFDTYVLLENGGMRVKSDAALRIFALLGAPWSLMGLGYVMPRAWRDALYDFVARHRVAWFGVRETCYVPTAADAGRFVQMKLLIAGGYGTFGGRIVELLEGEAALTLIVAGRSLASAEAYCAGRGTTAATLAPLLFDRDGDLAVQLAALAPDTVVDASGPFQAYGEDAYRLVAACIEARINYIDLADGSAFVDGIGAYDAAARAAGVYALSGVSSFPVLTAAVVRRLAAPLTRVDEIAGGIAPSPFAGVGANVIRAIASYAGQPVAYLGRTAKIIGRPFTQQRRYTIAPPGRLPLRNTLFSLVDVPDLRALSALWPQAKRVWMGAGPVPEVLHRALIFCAWLVNLGIMRTLAPLAPLMRWATNRLRWGEHRGGMFVEVKGMDAEGVAQIRSWHLLAEGDDGPLIPSMAVQAIVLKHLAGAPPRPGARACVDDIELEDYERLFASRTIYTGVRTPARADALLYERVLGDSWAALPSAIREMHDGAPSAEGRGRVDRGRSPLAMLAGAMMSFPPAGADVPVRVSFEQTPSGEVWRRTFGRHSFQSHQYEGRGKSERLIVERFGVLEFAMALVVEGERVRLITRRWSAFGVPMPMWFAPRSNAYESEANGVFHFFVEISHPLAGLIVRYSGWLKPQLPGGRTE